ncbi:hypothetical protein EZS27_039575, partial [termite gut metagenome]
PSPLILHFIRTMNSFAAFVKKELYHILRDKRTMLILLVMPVVQILLFRFAVTTEVNNVQVAIFGPSKDISTQQIVERFEASNYFTVTHILSNSEDINNSFKEKKPILLSYSVRDLTKTSYQPEKPPRNLLPTLQIPIWQPY